MDESAYVMDEAEIRAILAQGARDAAAFARLRRALGLAPAELGALLGLSEEAVARFETGAESPDAETWSLLERLVDDHLRLRGKVRDPGEWIGRGGGEPGGG
jgi:DNA-binding transcriptional regulator YiaG